MDFIQKIYYNNKPLILTDSMDAYVYTHPIAAGYMSFTGAFSRNFREAIRHLEKPATLGAIIQDFNVEALQDELYKIYKPVEAAGGVVTNENGDVLMIYRRGKWDLPKGKCDDGEDISDCAVREVSEETGLKNLKLGERICDTYHVYSQFNKNLLKCTTWYKMKGSIKDTLTPQEEENILEAKWIKEKELGPVIFKSYEAIREVLKDAGINWQ